jgi:hypothetical protein
MFVLLACPTSTLHRCEDAKERTRSPHSNTCRHCPNALSRKLFLRFNLKHFGRLSCAFKARISVQVASCVDHARHFAINYELPIEAGPCYSPNGDHFVLQALLVRFLFRVLRTSQEAISACLLRFDRSPLSSQTLC